MNAWYRILLFTALLGLSTPALSQTQFSSAGTKFVFGFIQNRTGPDGNPTNSNDEVHLSVYVANNSLTESAQVRIAFNGAPSSATFAHNGGLFGNAQNVYEFDVPPSDMASIEIIPTSPFRPSDLQIMGNNVIQTKAYDIESDLPISVFAESWQSHSRDVSLILPVASLGTEYYTAAYFPSPISAVRFGGPSEFAVVAVDTSIVHFTLEKDIAATVGGVTQSVVAGDYAVELLPGHCFQIQADFEDLTGIRIWSEDQTPFAVFSGNMAAVIPADIRAAADHVYEQMFPVEAWGCRYITPPLANDKWDAYKIIASEDNTQVRINGVPLQSGAAPVTLDRGEWIELSDELPTLNGVTVTNAPTNVVDPMLIEADQRICVVQYCISSLGAPNIANHDPFSIVLSPLSQTINDITFATMPQVNAASGLWHFVNIVTESNETDEVYLMNSMGVVDQASDLGVWSAVPGSAYSYITIALDAPVPDPHRFRLFSTGDQGFNAYAYGFADREAYGYAAGVNLTPAIIHTKDTLICEGEIVALEALGGETYHWRPSESLNCTDCPDPLASPNAPTMYHVEITSNCGVVLDSVFLDVIPAPRPILNQRYFMCEGDSVLLDPGGSAGDYEWSTGSQERSIWVKEPGTYTVRIENEAGCAMEAVTQVEWVTLPVDLEPLYTICEGDSVVLDAGGDYVGYQWSTGENNRSIVIKEAGVYSITVTDADGCTATASTTVRIGESLDIDLGPDMLLCNGASATLDAGGNYPIIEWSTGARTRRIEVSEPGIYEVRVENASGCEGFASIAVQAEPPFVTTLQPEYIQCGEAPIELNAGGDYSVYEWSTGESGSSILVSAAGTYSVRIESVNGCDTLIEVEVRREDAIIDLADAYTLCFGEPLELDAGDDYPTIEWSTGERARHVTISESGTYSVRVETAGGCIAEHTFSVEFVAEVDIDLESQVFICSGGAVELDAGGPFARYVWSDGSTDRTLTITEPGVYTVEVETAEGCIGQATVEALLQEPLAPAIEQIGALFVCSDAEITLRTAREYARYAWSNGATTREITIRNSGVYSVEVEDDQGCTGIATIEVVGLDVSISASAGIDDPLQFGRILMERSESQSVTVTNTGGDDIRIASVYLAHSSPRYSVRETPPVPAILTPEDAMTLDVIFTPDTIGEYTDSVIVEIDQPCLQRLAIPIFGTGYAKVLVWLPDTTAEIGDDICLPIGISLNFEAEGAIDFTWRAAVGWQESMFQPEASLTRSMTGQRIVGAERLATFEGEAVGIRQAQDVLTAICGITLLADITETPLVFSEFEALNPYVEIDTINGSLRLLHVCAHQLREFRFVPPPDVAVMPNPAKNGAQLRVTNSDAGDLRLRIVSMQGVTVAEFGWRHSSESSGEFKPRINTDDHGGLQGNGVEYTTIESSFYLKTDDIPAGVYQVVLSAPLRSVTRRLVIHR